VCTQVYVQHRMLDPAVAPHLWTLLAHPACHVYIAGAANQMPKAVRKALRDVAVAHGGFDDDGAADWLRKLESSKRLQCETW
jgi:sulfite reductase (NADPH) flavoprotein alpha-component